MKNPPAAKMTAREVFLACEEIVSVGPWPPGTRGLGDKLPASGRGFFPVSSGSFHTDDCDVPIGRRQIMFVGQDWGCEANLVPLGNDPDKDIKEGTGKHLRDLLDAAGISYEECFFTNALWGVRAGNKNTGPSPGWLDRQFVDRCTKALLEQIQAIRPHSLICLGRIAPRLLAGIFPKCGIWITAPTFAGIDEIGASIINLPSAGAGGVRKLALLVHPCYRKVNVKGRTHRNAHGNAAEIAILQDCR